MQVIIIFLFVVVTCKHTIITLDYIMHNTPFFSCSPSLIFTLSSTPFFTEHKKCNNIYSIYFPPPPFLPECDGLDATEIVNDITLERFHNCNIIVSGGIYIGSVANLKWAVTLCTYLIYYTCLLCHFISLTSFFLSSSSRLEILSTITEIRGPLRIQSWQGQTFPYLRNLRRVGHPNGTTLDLLCNDGQRCKFRPPSQIS